MSERLKASFRIIAEQMNRESGGHPSAEDLVDYHAGILQPEVEDRLQEHLSVCSECTQLLLDLPAFSRPGGEEGPSLSKADLTEAWERMRHRFSMGKETPTPGTDGRTRFPFSLSSAAWPYALAASLAVLSLALGFWTISLWSEKRQLARQIGQISAARELELREGEGSLNSARKELESAARRSRQLESEIADLHKSLDDVTQPQANVVVEDLLPKGYERGGEGVHSVDLPPASKLLTLNLHLSDPVGFRGLEAEILDQRANLIWRMEGLRINPQGTVSIGLSRQTTPAGRYQVRLFGRQGGRRQLLAEYSLRIRYP